MYSHTPFVNFADLMRLLLSKNVSAASKFSMLVSQSPNVFLELLVKAPYLYNEERGKTYYHFLLFLKYFPT